VWPDLPSMFASGVVVRISQEQDSGDALLVWLGGRPKSGNRKKRQMPQEKRKRRRNRWASYTLTVNGGPAAIPSAKNQHILIQAFMVGV
jgi:hypothetical protein